MLGEVLARNLGKPKLPNGQQNGHNDMYPAQSIA